MATIVLTGGGSAGHCTPHLALIPYLKNDFNKIVYIGSKNGIERDIIEREHIPYYFVPCVKFNRKFTLKNFSIPFKLTKGIMQAKKLLDYIKPDIIFSKGGYVSLPTVIAGKMKNIPVIAHESDYTIGLANKISAKFCKKILTSFPETAKSVKNGLYVGPPIRNPIRKEKRGIFARFGFDGTKPVLLVMGGSLGAVVVNNTVKKAIDELLFTFDIIHVCGKGNTDKTINKKGYFQTEFLSDIENAFAICDVCVTRAGSNALFELMNLQIPCVIIPLPKGASRGDQINNAEYFLKKGFAFVLMQENLTRESLILNINSAYESRFSLKRNFEKSPVRDASREISEILSRNKLNRS